MLRLTELRLPLDHTEEELRAAILKELGIEPRELVSYSIFRRSFDARKRGAIALIYHLDVETAREGEILRRLRGNPHVGPTPDTSYRLVAQAPRELATRPVVIGMGPCGLFAGLLLAEMGFRPIILERGKQVRERTVDTFGLWRKGILNPESNVQFGEGGAGTFSDGKLYSQIKDPGHRGRKVLTEFVEAGAPAEILFVNKPHIGTFRLVKMVEAMRAKIESLGGEIRFGSRVEDIVIEQGKVRGLILAGGQHLVADHVVLAVGHSARDTFEMLLRRGVYIEPKPFSIGFRIEHPQTLVDRCRFGPQAGHPLLGAADYKLVHHCRNGRSVYSFCMCPGGTVVAAASEPGRVVTNGMSQFVGDFLAGRPSTEFGGVLPSYRPGVRLGDLSSSLPDYAIEAIREALPAFDKQMQGFAMRDALLTGVETRTSSPIRIQRKEDFQSLNTDGLYPAGEGAGYAGGILSAGVDGIRVAEAVALSLVAAAPL